MILNKKSSVVLGSVSVEMYEWSLRIFCPHWRWLVQQLDQTLNRQSSFFAWIEDTLAVRKKYSKTSFLVQFLSLANQVYNTLPQPVVLTTTSASSVRGFSSVRSWRVLQCFRHFFSDQIFQHFRVPRLLNPKLIKMAISVFSSGVFLVF